MDDDQIIAEVQETLFISNSGVTVHTFLPDHPDSVIIQDVIENVVIKDVHCSHILEEGDIFENVIPEQVLPSDISEEASVAQYTIPASNMTTSLTMPEHFLMSEAIHMSDVGHNEHIFNNNIIEAEVINDSLTSNISELLMADYASESTGISGISVDKPDDDKNSFEDYLMSSLNNADKADHEDSTGINMNAVSGIDLFRVDDTCLEVIKVYIFKAHPGKDNLGGPVNIMETEFENDYGIELLDQNSSISVPRENKVYIEDFQQEYEDFTEITDEFYMKMIVGEKGTDVTAAGATAVYEQKLNDREMKAFMPVTWAEVYGNNSDGNDNQNGTNALIHIDELAGLGRLAKQKSKKRRRSESRQYQTEIIISPDGTHLIVHPCMFCGKKFKSRGYLKRHMKNHPEYLAMKKYHCIDCDYSTNKKISLYHHLESHKMTSRVQKAIKFNEFEKQNSHAGELTQKIMHKDKGANKMYKCKFCDYQTTEQRLLNRHLLAVHSKKFPHVCEECRKGFRHPSELKKHTRIHTGEKPYQCQHCEYRSADSSNLKTHVKTKHSKQQTISTCNICLLTFSNTRQAQQHARTHRVRKVHRCVHCGHKSSNSSDLKRHTISVHTKKYPHNCVLCGKGCHRPSELKKHIATHFKKKVQRCRHCKFKTTDSVMLNGHVVSFHTTDLMFRCEKCQKEFQQQSELKKHMKTHSGQKVYQCEYCDYSTTDASGFKRHTISIHTKDYPHCCEYCNKGFRRPSEKNRHIVRHHKEVGLPHSIY